MRIVIVSQMFLYIFLAINDPRHFAHQHEMDESCKQHSTINWKRTHASESHKSLGSETEPMLYFTMISPVYPIEFADRTTCTN